MNKKLVGLLALAAIFITTGFAMLFSAPTGVVHAEPLNQREPFTDIACLDCHTDQARLEELTTASEADEPEEASLSSGPG